jgi:hypothetical protein
MKIIDYVVSRFNTLYVLLVSLLQAAKGTMALLCLKFQLVQSTLTKYVTKQTYNFENMESVDHASIVCKYPVTGERKHESCRVLQPLFVKKLLCKGSGK